MLGWWLAAWLGMAEAADTWYRRHRRAATVFVVVVSRAARGGCPWSWPRHAYFPLSPGTHQPAGTSWTAAVLALAVAVTLSVAAAIPPDALPDAWTIPEVLSWVVPAWHAFAQTLVANPTATGNISDTEGAGELFLNNPRNIATFQAGGTTYGIVVAIADGGVQILDLSDPSSPTAAGQLADGGDLLLSSVQDVAIFTVSGTTYAAVTSSTAFTGDKGVQILKLANSTGLLDNPEDAGKIADTEGAGELLLGAALGVATFTVSGTTYAAVATGAGGVGDKGVQILKLADSTGLLDNPEDAGKIADDGSLELNVASGIDVFEHGGTTYAAVAATTDSGVQILKLADSTGLLDNPEDAGKIGDGGDLELNRPIGVATFTVSGTTYAAVAAQADDGVQILKLANSTGLLDNPEDAGKIADTEGAGELQLDGARDIATFTVSGTIYAAVAAHTDDGVQILKLADSTGLLDNPEDAGKIADGSSVLLDGPYGMALFEDSGALYAAVAVERDDAVQILRLTTAGTTPTTLTVDAGDDQTVNEGDTVTLMGTTQNAGGSATYAWTQTSPATPSITISDSTALTASFTAPDVTADTDFTFTLTVTDGTDTATDTVTVTVRDVVPADTAPPEFISAAYSVDTGILLVSFSEALGSTVDLGDLHVRGSGESSGGTALTGASASVSGSTLTVTLTSSQRAAAEALKFPQLDIDAGAVSDLAGNAIAAAPDLPIVITGRPAAFQTVTVTAPGSIGDDGDNTLLGGAVGIDTFRITTGGTTKTYAAVASHDDSGLQIVDLSDPDSPSASGHLEDTTATLLENARDVAIFRSGAKTYAAVTSNEEDGLQIVDVSTPANPTAAGKLADTEGSGELLLNGATKIDVFGSGAKTYAAIASQDDDGIQIVDITTPGSPTAVGQLTDDTTTLLDEPIGIAVFRSGASTYAAVTNNGDHGLQIVNITDPANPSGTDSLADTESGDDALLLEAPWAVDTFRIGSSIYAAVVSQTDDGLQIVDITDPGDISAAGKLGNNGTLELDRPWDVATFHLGQRVYAAIAAQNDDGVQIVDVTDPDNPAPAGRLPDDADTLLDGPSAVTIFRDGGSTYAAVASYDDGAVQVVQLAASLRSEPPPSHAFVTTWTTTDADQTITFPGTGTYDISWGDGSTDEGASGSTTHTYAAAGTYTVSVTGGLTRINLGDTPDANAARLASIEQWGNMSWRDMNSAFEDASTMVYNADDSPDLTGVTDMVEMFRDASRFNGNISSWDVSSVTSMVGMFLNAAAFNQPLNDWAVSSVTNMNNMFLDAAAFNQPLNDWDVSSVTHMNQMFYDARAFNQPLNDWAVSSVTNMGGMFRGASAFNQDISGWDVSSVTDMRNTFSGATAFNQNLGLWYVTPGTATFDATGSSLNVTEMTAQNRPLRGHNPTYGIGTGGNSELFEIVQGSSTLAFKADPDRNGRHRVNVTASDGSVFEDGNNWRMVTVTVSGVSVTERAFITTWKTTTTNQTITLPVTGSGITIDWGDGSAPSTGVSTTTTHRYENAGTYTVSVTGSLERFSLSNGPSRAALASIEQWGSAAWTDMNGAFQGASNMVYNATDSPDLSSVTDMRNMFRDATRFNGDISGWDVAGVTRMGGMFSGAAAFNQPLNDWDVSSVTDMSAMFQGTAFFNRDLSSWDVSSATDMSDMFNGATTFNQDISGWDVSSATNMVGMFTSADDFDRNLGPWYITPGIATFDASGSSPNVIRITAQNSYLDGQSPTYGIGDGGNSGLFEIVSGSTLAFKATPTLNGTYTATVTAAGFGVFERGNNERTVTVTVTGAAPPSEAALENAFITTWTTTSGDQQITLPVSGSTMTVFWGDDTASRDVSGRQTHTYENAGTYTVSITGGLNRINLGHSSSNDANDGRLAYIQQWGNSSWTTMEDAFLGASNMDYNATDSPDLTGVTEMTAMFRGATSFNGNISGWDVAGVTHMDNMFFDAAAFNQPLNDWDVSSVTDMDAMFSFSAFNQPLNDWDVSSVTGMAGMFYGTPFNQDISGWDVAAATDMHNMFRETPFNRPLNSWNVSQVTLMSSMFRDADDFNRPLSSWNVSQVTDMNGMFYGASRFNQNLNSWDVSSVTNMREMFRGVDFFDQPLNDWDVSAVTNMGGMFRDTDFFDQPLNDWDVSSVTSMSSMFRDADFFNQPLNDWDVSSVTSMSSMFRDARIFKGNISSWDVSAVTNMGNMFRDAQLFTQPLNSWDVSAVTDMSGMFYNARAFNHPLSSWDVSQVTTMTEMFVSAQSFYQNLGSWYITPGAVDYDTAGTSLEVAEIAAQNSFLDGHNPVYRIVPGGNHTLFRLSSSDTLSFRSAPTVNGIYTVTLNATGADVFEDGLNERTIRVGVGVSVVPPPVVTPPPTITVPDNAFVTTWTTTADDQQITLPVTGSGMTVFWGDNQTSTNVSGPATHTYATAGTYTVSVAGDLASINLGSTDSDNARLLSSIEQWGDASWTTMNGTFHGARNMAYNADDAPDLSGVTDMANMFRTARSFNADLSSWNVSTITDMAFTFYNTVNFNGDISSWDVSSVTDMTGMFGSTASFNQDLSGWNVSSVTDMDSMFSEARAFNGDVSSWDVSSVTDMHHMFRLATAFNQDLSGWDVSSVTRMVHMFLGATAFNGDVSTWNVSAVTNMGQMFWGATAFNQDISGWDVSSATILTQMFENAARFNQDISGWDVSGVTDMGGILDGATSFDQNLGLWYVTPGTTTFDASGSSLNVTEMTAQNSILRGQNPAYGIGAGYDADLFEIVSASDTLAFQETPVRNGDYRVNVTASGTKIFEDGNNWRVVRVTVSGAPIPAGSFATTWTTTIANQTITFPGTGTYNIDWGDGSTPSTGVSGHRTHTYAIADTYRVIVTGGLTAVNLGSTTPANAALLASIEQWGNMSWATMNGTFRNANNMVYRAGDSPDLTGVTDMTAMFWGTTAFNGDISSWDVSSVTDMSDMFFSASTFNRPLASWNVAAVTDMSSMFNGAERFNQPLNSWDVSSVTDMSGMFALAFAFNQPLSSWDVSSATTMSRMFLDATNFNGDISSWDISAVTNMHRMFLDATAFNQDISSWNVEAVTDMDDMFSGASAFEQNLGPWYVTPGTATFAASGTSLNVTEMTAQNRPLRDHNPVYGIGTGGDSDQFVIVSGSNTLAFSSTPTDNVRHRVNVTATGTSVFETGNNWRMVSVTVSGAPDPDTTAPTITILGSNPVTISLGSNYADRGATCTDETDGSRSVTADTSGVITATVGTYTVTYTCTDASNNQATATRTVKVVDAAVDSEPPVITLRGANPSAVEVGSTYSDAGATCTDEADGALGVTTDTSGVDTATAGTYKVTYTCTDGSNNQAAAARTILVRPPTTDTPPDLFLRVERAYVGYSGPYPDYSSDAICTDTEDGDISNLVTFSVSAHGTDAGTITYSCTDSDGNTDTVTRQVHLTDTNAPTVVLYGHWLVEINVGSSYTDARAYCVDDQDGTFDATTKFSTVDTASPGTYEVFYVCTDSRGNSASGIRVVQVQPAATNLYPVLSVPGPVTITVGDAFTAPSATCTDPEDGDLSGSVWADASAVDTGTPGRYKVLYTCTDGDDNFVAGSTYVHVEPER